jgi:hypothetical protein
MLSMPSEPTEEIERAEGLIRDAERCKLLLAALHESASPRDPALCPLQGHLAQLAAQLETFLAAHIQASLKVGNWRKIYFNASCFTFLMPEINYYKKTRS